MTDKPAPHGHRRVVKADPPGHRAPGPRSPTRWCTVAAAAMTVLTTGLLPATVAGCGTGATAPTPTAEVSLVPTDRDRLRTWLAAGKYTAFEARDAAVHDSAGPHGRFRTWFDPRLAESLRQPDGEHPQGAAAVMELFNRAGKPAGWAVAVKTGLGSEAGRGWYWFETSSPDATAAPAVVGNGVRQCIGCHAKGRDFVLGRPR